MVISLRCGIDYCYHDNYMHELIDVSSRGTTAAVEGGHGGTDGFGGVAVCPGSI